MRALYPTLNILVLYLFELRTGVCIVYLQSKLRGQLTELRVL